MRWLMRQRLSPRATMAVLISGMSTVPPSLARSATCSGRADGGRGFLRRRRWHRCLGRARDGDLRRHLVRNLGPALHFTRDRIDIVQSDAVAARLHAAVDREGELAVGPHSARRDKRLIKIQPHGCARRRLSGHEQAPSVLGINGANAHRGPCRRRRGDRRRRRLRKAGNSRRPNPFGGARFWKLGNRAGSVWIRQHHRRLVRRGKRDERGRRLVVSNGNRDPVARAGARTVRRDRLKDNRVRPGRKW